MLRNLFEATFYNKKTKQKKNESKQEKYSQKKIRIIITIM